MRRVLTVRLASAPRVAVALSWAAAVLPQCLRRASRRREDRHAHRRRSGAAAAHRPPTRSAAPWPRPASGRRRTTSSRPAAGATLHRRQPDRRCAAAGCCTSPSTGRSAMSGSPRRPSTRRWPTWATTAPRLESVSRSTRLPLSPTSLALHAARRRSPSSTTASPAPSTPRPARCGEVLDELALALARAADAVTPGAGTPRHGRDADRHPPGHLRRGDPDRADPVHDPAAARPDPGQGRAPSSSAPASTAASRSSTR